MFGKRIFLSGLIMLLALILSACGGESGPAATPAPSGDAAAGEQLYVQSCSSCHGPDATGISGLGKDLVHSDFTKAQSDTELVAFIKQGRPVSDPANTTGVDMPPKGGNPALTDSQILDIVAYLRTVQE